MQLFVWKITVLFTTLQIYSQDSKTIPTWPSFSLTGTGFILLFNRTYKNSMIGANHLYIVIILQYFVLHCVLCLQFYVFIL